MRRIISANANLVLVTSGKIHVRNLSPILTTNRSES